MFRAAVLRPAFQRTQAGHLHRVLGPWDEGTVTWSSFADAFNPVAFKSFSTASGTLVLNVAPQVQAWVNGSVPNHGLLIEQPGALQTKYRTQEYLVPAQRPVLHVCYTLSCAPGFADCNGVAADGCEADLHSPATCGAKTAPGVSRPYFMNSERVSVFCDRNARRSIDR